MKTVKTWPEVLTLEEAAKYLRLPRKTVKREAEQGKVPGQRVGRTWRFSRVALELWLRGHDSKSELLKMFGALKDDETLPELRRQVYEGRGRPEAEDERLP